jgi:hypothetical protein
MGGHKKEFPRRLRGSKYIEWSFFRIFPMYFVCHLLGCLEIVHCVQIVETWTLFNRVSITALLKSNSYCCKKMYTLLRETTIILKGFKIYGCMLFRAAQTINSFSVRKYN